MAMAEGQGRAQDAPPPACDFVRVLPAWMALPASAEPVVHLSYIEYGWVWLGRQTRPSSLRQGLRCLWCALTRHAKPTRGLSSARARRVLGFEPQHSWRDHVPGH